MTIGNNVLIITPAQFGQFAPEVVVSQYTPETISGLLLQASSIVSDILGYTPIAENLTNELATASITTDGDLVIFPGKLPVNSVTAIGIQKGATNISINLTDGAGNNKYNLDYSQRTIRYPYGEITLTGVPIFTDFYALRGNQFYTKISYNGGWSYQNLPGSIQQAVVLVMRDILAKRENSSGAIEMSQGAVSLKFSDKDTKSRLIKEAERLLRPFRR